MKKNNPVLLIIAREYLTRVRKKSFILLTILLPILMAAIIMLPVLLMINSEKKQHTHVLVVDETEIFLNAFEPNDNVTFSYASGDINTFKQDILQNDKYNCILHILDNSQALKSNLYYKDKVPNSLPSYIERQMDDIFFDRILQDSLHINPAQFEKLQELTKAEVTTIQMDDKGNERENIAEINEVIGMVCGFFIYFIIIIFASQVLRGVLEEKTSRIVEVIVSSVKPVQLLIGKIVGIALVGITQFVIWVMLTFGILLVAQIAAPSLMSGSVPETAVPGAEIAADTLPADFSIFQKINEYFSVSFGEIILCFFFFFVVGYLIYASLYAAMGSVVDNESDSQQYTLPITLPLLLSIIVVPSIANNPNGSLAFWFSMIPLTSPVSMLVRLPAGVPLWQVFLSMGLAVAFLVFCIWFAAKVYRMGILMYGKKVSWREIFKWLRK